MQRSDGSWLLDGVSAIDDFKDISYGTMGSHIWRSDRVEPGDKLIQEFMNPGTPLDKFFFQVDSPVMFRKSLALLLVLSWVFSSERLLSKASMVLDLNLTVRQTLIHGVPRQLPPRPMIPSTLRVTQALYNAKRLYPRL